MEVNLGSYFGFYACVEGHYRMSVFLPWQWIANTPERLADVFPVLTNQYDLPAVNSLPNSPSKIQMLILQSAILRKLFESPESGLHPTRKDLILLTMLRRRITVRWLQSIVHSHRMMYKSSLLEHTRALCRTLSWFLRSWSDHHPRLTLEFVLQIAWQV